MRDCDKCGRFVPSNNDAAELDAIINPGNIFSAFTVSRHLLSTIHCEGSPSRAQYLPNQPRDGRGFTYRPELEDVIRDAFERIQ